MSVIVFWLCAMSYHGHKSHKHCVPITLCGSYSCNEMHWNCPCVWVLISMPVVLPWQHLCILMEWSVSERLGSAPHLHSWHRKLVAWAGMLHDPATYSAASIGSWLHGLRCCTSQLRTVQLAVVLSRLLVLLEERVGVHE